MTESGNELRARILEALRQVQDPDLHRDIVSLGFVKNLQVRDGRVSFDVQLTTPACPVKEELQRRCEQVVARLDGVESVSVRMTAQPAGAPRTESKVLAGVANVIAVASGKGGVGKSTTAVNLALGLRETGATVGLMDADVYGPSIPIMLGATERPRVTTDRRLLPSEAHGIRLMSMGFLSQGNEAVIWRGPMVSNMIQQFLGVVDWGELDYLVIDLPPGTGDTQLTLTQQAPLSGAVIVTTPQEVSLVDARKGLRMFQQVNVPILGIVENMSYYVCEGCGRKAEIFGSGGGERVAAEFGVPLLGRIPIDPAVVSGGDTGRPILIDRPDSPVSIATREFAGNVAARLSSLGAAGDAVDGSFRLEWK
jgi:ATP-binding protein involved in chromosome partitioning